MLSFLFDNKEDKIRENKSKLKKSLQDGTHPMLNEMHEKVQSTFQNEIISKGVDDFGNMLNRMANLLANLGSVQAKLANNLMKKYYDLNLELLQHAVEYSRQPVFLSSVDYIARIPGKQFLIVAGRSSIDNKKISLLLGENFSVLQSDEMHEIIGTILNCGYRTKTFAIDPNNSVSAILPTDAVNETNFTLAQQIAGIPIFD